MNEEETLSGAQSLEIIHQMINKAKVRYTDNGIGWLVWGSLIFCCSIATFIFIKVGYKDIWLAWNIFGISAMLMLLYRFFVKKKKDSKVRTYIDDVLRYVDLAFLVSIFLIILSINLSQDPNIGFGYFLMIYGFLMLVQGGVMQFKPLIIGAVVNWVGTIGIFINNRFEYDMLITAASVLIGYIIPGLLLYYQSKKEISPKKLSNGI